MRAPLHVLILGGGFAGLETAFLLRHRLRERVRLTLVSDEPRFLFRPNTIYVPFGLELAGLEVPLHHALARRDIELVQGRAWGLDPVSRIVELAGGRRIGWDMLVIATGAAAHLGAVPGLAGRATSVWTPGGMMALRGKLDRAAARSRDGVPTRFLFLVPPGCPCPGPLYELVHMADVHLRRCDGRHRVELAWASPDAHFLPAFGPRVHEVVARELERCGIEAYRNHVARHIDDGLATFEDGQRISFDELVTFPPEVAAVTWSALPRDDRGFLRCVPETRAVSGHPGIYAPGDAGDFPVKQAYLALLQAHAVAGDIASHVDHRPSRAGFDAVTMTVLEQLDTATFARVPLRVRGGPSGPQAEVDPARVELYEVRNGKGWRLAKKGLALYTTRRFAAGEPFHAGLGWSLLDLGLKAMTGRRPPGRAMLGP
ncbi:MAG: FAD-dependent oxidoreductase [Myxococcota bacterium]